MIATPWGYSVDADALPPLADLELLAKVAGGFADTARASAALEAASAAVRSHCGWHVFPVLKCKAVTSGPGRLVALPTIALSSVSRVTELGSVLQDGQYEWRVDGLLRRCGWREWPRAWRSVEVEFESGLTGEAAAAVAQVACQVAASALATSAGVSREQAGDVSVTYSQPGGVALLDRDMAMLAPYRLPTMAG